MHLPENVEYILSRINESGYRADIVGGCVRDCILGKEPNDYDVTTNAKPEAVREIFSDLRTVDTGIKHGTVAVIIDSEPYEITTYRRDGKYSDNRHPDSVSFADELSDDLSRRDFTVNAMCYNHRDGFTDLFGGRRDIDAKIIRAVGNPRVRFEEDALRVMRALRFASVLDFAVEENTARAIEECAGLVAAISAERIYTEWKKLIGGIAAYRILREYQSVIGRIIPALCGYSLPDEELFKAESGDIRELSLFALGGGKAAFEEAMTALKCDTKHRKYGIAVLSALEYKSDTEAEKRLLLVKLGKEAALGAVRLKILLGRAEREEYAQIFSLIEAGAPATVGELKINGNDLKELGYRGREIGDILEGLLLATAEGKVENERESLLSFVAKIR